MGIFKIDADHLEWIGGKKDDPEDQCLHGHAVVQIGDITLEYDYCTVSATALYLLKTLTENHIINKDNQIIPCCGHFWIAENDLMNVTILGCPNGIDWSVLHEGENVRLVLEGGQQEVIPLAEYKQEVFRFVDKIEAFYNACTPKKIPTDEFERNGYIAFWNEWHRRRWE